VNGTGRLQHPSVDPGTCCCLHAALPAAQAHRCPSVPPVLKKRWLPLSPFTRWAQHPAPACANGRHRGKGGWENSWGSIPKDGSENIWE